MVDEAAKSATAALCDEIKKGTFDAYVHMIRDSANARLHAMNSAVSIRRTALRTVDMLRYPGMSEATKAAMTAEMKLRIHELAVPTAGALRLSIAGRLDGTVKRRHECSPSRIDEMVGVRVYQCQCGAVKTNVFSENKWEGRNRVFESEDADWADKLGGFVSEHRLSIHRLAGLLWLLAVVVLVAGVVIG